MFEKAAQLCFKVSLFLVCWITLLCSIWQLIKARCTHIIVIIIIVRVESVKIITFFGQTQQRGLKCSISSSTSTVKCITDVLLPPKVASHPATFFPRVELRCTKWDGKDDSRLLLQGLVEVVVAVKEANATVLKLLMCCCAHVVQQSFLSSKHAKEQSIDRVPSRVVVKLDYHRWLDSRRRQTLCWPVCKWVRIKRQEKCKQLLSCFQCPKWAVVWKFQATSTDKQAGKESTTRGQLQCKNKVPKTSQALRLRSHQPPLSHSHPQCDSKDDLATYKWK